ncbi:MAG: hypothetical protein M1829_004702 [Trizodia sp. TS-e1964]|nr:MAG: hypothetical protein M1829_004702 [Trizodia sp. TS-e1964]
MERAKGKTSFHPTAVTGRRRLSSKPLSSMGLLAGALRPTGEADGIAPSQRLLLRWATTLGFISIPRPPQSVPAMSNAQRQATPRRPGDELKERFRQPGAGAEGPGKNEECSAKNGSLGEGKCIEKGHSPVCLLCSLARTCWEYMKYRA